MNSTPEQLRFASIPAHSVRADFTGGGLSSDLGPILLRGIDLQIGLTARIAAALPDRRHQSYVNHSYHDILTQRIYQIGCGYEDGNDSNSLRHDPMFKLGAARLPFDDGAALASRATISRFEHAARRQDIYRVSEALVEQFIAGFASPPKSLILDLDHAEDACYGQQPLAFYNHHYGSTCYLPLMLFDGQSGALIAAVLRPGKRPFGEENAMIMRRVLKLIRRHFPDTHILVRGDGHFSGPELMGLIDSMPNTDFIFGFSSNVKLNAMAEPTKLRACDLWVAAQTRDVVPNSVRLFDEFTYKARSWPRAWRVLMKAEVMALGENTRFIVTSLMGVDAGTPKTFIARAVRPKTTSSISRMIWRPIAPPAPASWPIACACCCMQRLMSCTSNCVRKRCSIPRFQGRSHRPSSRNFLKSPCRSGSTKTKSSSICQARALSKNCCRH
jgi:hypothetical protein